MKGTFRAASRRQRNKSSTIVIGVTVRKRDPKIDGSHLEPVNHKRDERTECQTAQPMADAGPPTPEILQTSESRQQWVYPRYTKIGPPVDEDWTPGRQGLDPRCAETGPPRDKATGPSIPDENSASQDQGLHGIQDFVGFGTSWDSRLRGTRDFMGFKTSRDIGLRGIQDFVGHGTSWDLGLCRKQELYTTRTRILFCGVL